MLRDSRITCVAPHFSRSRVVGSRRYFRLPTRWSALFQPPVGFILDRLYPLFGPRGPFPVGFIAVSDSRGRVRLGPEPGGDPASRRGRSPTSRRGATCLGIDRKPPPSRVGGLGSRLRGQSVSPPLRGFRAAIAGSEDPLAPAPAASVRRRPARRPKARSEAWRVRASDAAALRDPPGSARTAPPTTLRCPRVIGFAARPLTLPHHGSRSSAWSLQLLVRRSSKLELSPRSAKWVPMKSCGLIGTRRSGHCRSDSGGIPAASRPRSVTRAPSSHARGVRRRFAR